MALDMHRLTQIQTYQVVSLGCRTNHYEAQGYRDQLKALGIREYDASVDARCDLCIVNTCTVTAAADTSSRHRVRQLHRLHPSAEIWVTGCSAHRDPKVFQSLDGVTAVIGNLDKETLMNCIFPDETIPEFKVIDYDQQTRAFIKVQDGCNSFCSYCVIPYVRGRSRSRSIDAVVDEAKGLVQRGFKEIVLTGINIGDFDGGGGKSLAQLIGAIDSIEGVERVRLSSIDPDEVDDALIEALLNGKHTTPTLHIVLQSGSNYILKRMRRKYTRQQFLESCRRLLTLRPEFTFTTDIIVGFPGESDSDYAQTLDIVEQTRFAKVHMFPYSRRPMTRAARFTDELSDEVIHERRHGLMQLSARVAFNLREEYVGRDLHVLIESSEIAASEHHELARLAQKALASSRHRISSGRKDSFKHIYGGHSEHFFYVYLLSEHPIAVGSITPVHVVANHPSGLIAIA